MRHPRFYSLVSALLLTTMLTACVEERVVARPAPAVVVRSAPPAEIVEQVPVSPGPNWAWQRGHWRWDGYRYYWQPGHWVQRPPRVSMWVAPHWEARPGGYFFVEGRWQ